VGGHAALLILSRVSALGLVVALGNCLVAQSLEPPIDEYKVKAAFLYNFAKFVQWPAEAFQSATEPITICILGQDPFGSSLEDTVAHRPVEGRSFIVRHISTLKQGAGCHVLFVSSAENKRSSPSLADIQAPGILTIGESDSSNPDGSVINLRLDGGKVRFDINVAAADRAKLHISSRLLSLAHVIEPTHK
jgi:hypothetical protein